MAGMTESELTSLQHDAVAALGRASSDPKHVLTGEAAALLLAIPALCDEVRRLRSVLAFAKSVIQSGESWTATCEDLIGGALRGDDAPPQ